MDLYFAVKYKNEKYAFNQQKQIGFSPFGNVFCEFFELAHVYRKLTIWAIPKTNHRLIKNLICRG